MAALACRFFCRDPSAGILLLRMAGWVAALSVLIRVLPLPRLLKLIEPRSRRAVSPRQASAVQARLGHLIDLLLSADFLFFTPTCWKRAPVLHRYLALNGIETRIVFGVRKNGEGLLAGHAWLESGGEPMLESSVPDYRVTYSFPS